MKYEITCFIEDMRKRDNEHPTREMCNCKCEFDILFPLEEGHQIEFKMHNF